MSERPICDYCGNKVRNRYTTYIMPSGERKYTHGKERWFPEVYKLFQVDKLPYKIYQGEKGEILDWRQGSECPHCDVDVPQTLYCLNCGKSISFKKVG